MDSATVAPERISWPRRWWRLFTVQADKRCSRCLRRAVVRESFTAHDDERGWTRRTEVRHCAACSQGEAHAFGQAAQLAIGDDSALMCGILPTLMWSEAEIAAARGGA